MKKTLIGTIILLAFSCALKKNTTVTTMASLQSECPKNAKCEITILDNKSLIVSQDEFGGIYYRIENDLQKKVVKYSYSNIVKGDIQDAGYREEIVFELDDLNDQEFADADIQKTKMLFGRFCYCKGKTGNYKVGSGKLTIKDKKASLNFTITEVPQVIKAIQFDFK